MGRLIDAYNLYRGIVKKGQASKRYKVGEYWELNGAEIWKVIETQPTVDAVEVIRCRDCVYYEMLNNNEYYCDAIYRDLHGDDEGVDFEPPEDHFCAYGKRRVTDEKEA